MKAVLFIDIPSTFYSNVATVIDPSLPFLAGDDSSHDENGNPLEQGQAHKVTSSAASRGDESRYNRVQFDFENQSKFPRDFRDYDQLMTTGEKDESGGVTAPPGGVEEKKEKRDRRNKKKEGNVCKAQDIKGQ